jgi:hypothetical protein
MGEPRPDARETDTWFSADQLAGLKRADAADGLRSPIPLQMVSSGEYLPIPQTAPQKEIEAGGRRENLRFGWVGR